MAKKKRKKSDRRKIDLTSSKVFWVILLSLISFTFAFPQVYSVLGRSAEDVTADRLFGEAVTRGEIQTITRGLRLVRQNAGEFFQRGGLLTPDEISPLTFYMYLHEARALGLRVSDAELGEKRRDLWRQRYAAQKAAEELAGTLDTQNQQNAYIQLYMKQQEILEKLEEHNAFDLRDYEEGLRQQKASPAMFEAALREVMLVSKLDAYLRSRVVVNDKEVYERFLEQDQKRKPRWIDVEVTEELENAVRESLTDDDLEKYLAANIDDFRLGYAIQCEYFMVPRSYFEEKVRSEITEADLRRSYENDKGSYPRPQIRGDAGLFTLRSEREMQQLEGELFLPFEDVRDQVEQKAVRERAGTELSRAYRDVTDRLFPREAGARRATFAEVRAQFPYVVLGNVPPTVEAEAKEGFGEAYTTQLSTWYATARKLGDLDENQRKAIAERLFLRPEQAGYVAYRNVAVHDPRDPELAEVREQVADALYEVRVQELVEKALEDDVAALDAGEKALADLAGSDLAVTIEEGKTATARYGELAAGADLVGRYDQVRVPKAEADDADDAESSPNETDDEDSTEPHPSSTAIRNALFAISAPGNAGVARDDAAGKCFVVSYDEMEEPKVAEFDDRKGALRRQLVSERENEIFASWRAELLRRAQGVVAADGAKAATADVEAES